MTKYKDLKIITKPSGEKYRLCDTAARRELRIVEIVGGILIITLFALILR